MKKVILALAILILLQNSAALGDEETYCESIKPTQYNEIWSKHFESDFKINYDPDDDTFVFYSDETLTIFGFVIDRSQADSLMSIIDKYKDWNIKASNKKVKLEKEIASFPVKFIFWKMGDEWSVDTSSRVSAYFFSQTDQVHQLVFIFPKAVSINNEYDTHTGEPLYFDWNNALELRRVLTRASVNNFIEEVKKQAKIESEFK